MKGNGVVQWIDRGLGLLLALEGIRYLFLGWTHSHFVDQKYFFPHWGGVLELQLSPWIVNAAFAALVLAGIAIYSSFIKKWALAVCALGWGLVFWMDRTHYLNHFYFLFLVLILRLGLGFVPDSEKPSAKKFPLWFLSLWLLVGLVYFFAGVAKLNSDWWLHAQPLKQWLLSRSESHGIPAWLLQNHVLLVLARGTAIFEICFPALVFFRFLKTPILVLMALFHALNAYLWNIGIFPFLMLLLMGLYLPNQRALVQILRMQFLDLKKGLKFLFAGFFILQLVLPIRHFFIPGNVLWTEEGHRYAWRMKLRAKHVDLEIYRLSQNGILIPWTWWEGLTQKQKNQAAKHPDMLQDWLKWSMKQEHWDHSVIQLYLVSNWTINQHKGSGYYPNRILLEKGWRLHTALNPLE